MTKKYLIKLTPHDYYFFGGEKTFGASNEENYFVKSNYFPQQNGLLGLIRYQLLVHCNDPKTFKDNRIQNKTNAANLIGRSSFAISDETEVEKAFPFGKIKGLSPLFIADADNNFLFPANKEYQWIESEKDADGENQSVQEFRFREYKIKHGNHCLDQYDPKTELPDILINKDGSVKKKYDYNSDTNCSGTEKQKKANGIFTKKQKVGIWKDYKGASDDKSYFIQTYLGLKEGYSFAFILEVDEDAILETNAIVHLGGERSSFNMEVISENKLKLNYNDLIPNYEKSLVDKVVLVSNAFVKEDITDTADFAITELEDYRFLTSTVEKGHHSYSKFSKSNKYNLYKKGSVFYGKADAIIAALETPCFKQLGYNHSIKINKK